MFFVFFMKIVVVVSIKKNCLTVEMFHFFFSNLNLFDVFSADVGIGTILKLFRTIAHT